MLAHSRKEKQVNINLDHAFFFSPNTFKHSQHSTLSHPPPSQLPPLPPVPASQSSRSSQSLPRSATQHLPPKPPTLPPKPNHASYHQSPTDATSLPPTPPLHSLKAALPTLPFIQAGFERITHEPVPTPGSITLPYVTKADILADRAPTVPPTAWSSIDNHGAGHLDVGFSPQRVRLRTSDSPDSTHHRSEARQRQTSEFNRSRFQFEETEWLTREAVGQPPCIPGKDQNNLSNDTGVANVSKSPILPSPHPALGNSVSASFGNSLLSGNRVAPSPAPQVQIPETTRPKTSALADSDRNPGQPLEGIASDLEISNAHKPPEEQFRAMQHCSLGRRQPSALSSGIDKAISISQPSIKAAENQDGQFRSSDYSRNIGSAASIARDNVTKWALPSLEGTTVAAANRSPPTNRLLAYRDSNKDRYTQCRKRCQSVAGIDSVTSDEGAVRRELKHAMRSSCPPQSPREAYQPEETQQTSADFKEFAIDQAVLKCVRIGEETTFCITGFCDETSLPYLAPNATDHTRIEPKTATFDVIFRDASKRQQFPSCTNRSIRPSANRSRKSWTPAEDSKILGLKKLHAGWPEIFAALPDRTEAAIKARYFSKLAKITGPTCHDPEEFEVEALLARRPGLPNEYLVKWKGYSEEENSWVEQDDISTELVIEFERNHAIHGGLFSGIRLLMQDHGGGDAAKYLVQFQGRPSEENMWLCTSEVSGKLVDEFKKLHKEG
ncbi:hypothetical protein FOMA001_g2254 [Fusarium oxysporum f. sp. matthiolae]|nr:hypothetical protein FOMA001_g2254 [Fusarium oxysporum f. sp. matthiolae]